MISEYQEKYLKKFSDFNPLDTKTISTGRLFAGNETGFKKIDKMKITSKLLGERYDSNIFNYNLDSAELKKNTAIQRTWIGYKDASIKTIEELNIDNTKEIILPPIDNELSINVGSKI